MSSFKMPIINVHFDVSRGKFVARTELIPQNTTLGDTPEKAIASLKILIEMWKQGARDKTQAKYDLDKYGPSFINSLLD